MDSRADDILRKADLMIAQRATFDQHWREIAERILPRSNLFQRYQERGQKATERVFDATATLALERFSAAMESMLTPRTQRWHKLKTTNRELNEIPAVRQYLDAVTEVLFNARYAPTANFASQTNEAYMSLGAFGTGGMFIDEMMGQGLRYRAVHLSELYIAENHQGIIDTVYRKFAMTLRQFAQRFGREKMSQRQRGMLEKDPEQNIDVIHAVHPNDEIESVKRSYRGMPIASCYVNCETREIVSEGGFRTMPYAVGRYVTAPKEVYGRSPAMTVLPDIKMLNEMSKVSIRAAHKMVDPPLLLQDDGALQAFDLRPGALNYGGVDEQGRQLVHAMTPAGRIDIGLEMMDQRRQVINDAFLVTLFQILVDAPTMTATEAMLRAQEKGALLAPTMGRQQSEFLGPLIERELDILARAGNLPPMPEELMEAGAEVDIEYVSPLNRAQRADEGVAILRTLESISPLAQIDPSVMMVFDPMLVARELADINGVPQKVLRSPEQIAEMQAEAAQAQQAQALLQAAPVIGKTTADLARAQSLAGAAPGQVAPQIFAA
jgi:hypothetical protein